MSSKLKLGWMLLSGASLAAMGAFSPAMAQETSEEIVVTATGRAAALQDVPVAVTAITGDQMENSGVEDLRDLTQLAPSFSMGTGQSLASTTARIRGIGTGGDNVGFEASSSTAFIARALAQHCQTFPTSSGLRSSVALRARCSAATPRLAH